MASTQASMMRFAYHINIEWWVFIRGDSDKNCAADSVFSVGEGCVNESCAVVEIGVNKTRLYDFPAFCFLPNQTD